MAGFWHLSSTMQFDNLGVPAPGAQAYFYAADVLVDLAVYKDSALTVKWNQPVPADGYGRFQNVYLDNSAASSYRFRVTDQYGEELIALGTIPIALGGGGGGSAVDATTLLSTGDCWWSPVDAVRAGAVRLNGRTIGSATSGATERANADTNALFLFLWTNLPALAVSTGRGASAAADWAANKNIALPDARGRGLLGLDAMGNAAAGRLTLSFAANSNVAGAAFGVDGFLLSAAQIPTHTHTIPSSVAVQSGAGTNVTSAAGAGQNTGSGTGLGGTNTMIVQPSMLGTFFIKL